jgi:hypothetical protein
MDQKQTLPSRKRRREALSCEPCRRMKIKCDQKAPCNQCSIRSRSDACVYSKDSRPPHSDDQRISAQADVGITSNLLNAPPLPPTAASSATIPTPPFHLAGSVTDASRTGSSLSSHIPINLLEDDTRSSEQHTVYSTADYNALLLKVAQLEETIATLSQVRSQHITSTTETISPKVTTKFAYSKTRAYGQSHWMNTVIEVAKLMFGPFLPKLMLKRWIQ